METLHIGTLRVRCRLASAANEDRVRVTNAFANSAAAALDQVIHAAGLEPREEICIRRLVVPARLWLGLTDEALVAQWASSVIEQLRRIVDACDPDEIVRYHSPVEAVVDAVRGTVRRTTARRWAWRQLGLPQGRAPEIAIVELLMQHPAAIVPAVRVLAEDSAFRAAIGRLDDETLAALASAALAYAGLNVDMADVAEHEVSLPDTRAGSAVARAHLVAARSQFAPVARSRPSPLGRLAVAALSVLEVEPALMRGRVEEIRAALAAVAAEIGGVGTSGASGGARSSAGDTSAAPRGEGVARRWPSPDGRGPTGDVPTRTRRRPPADETTGEGLVADGRRDDGATAESQQPGQAGRIDTPGDTGAAEAVVEDGPLDLRCHAFSEWAGLLFIINAARDVSLADAALDHPALVHRPLWWVLQRIALLLVPTTATDPAVRAFAGLVPDARLPQVEDVEPDEAEHRALLVLAQLLIGATCERLDRPATDEAMYEVCGRRGEIVADPGWIEVRFPADAVSIDVRRAGLDRDPGYVEWLGIVLKFAYV